MGQSLNLGTRRDRRLPSNRRWLVVRLGERAHGRTRISHFQRPAKFRKAPVNQVASIGNHGHISEGEFGPGEHKVHGVGIIQPGNALRALRTLGLMDICLSEGFQTDHYVMYDAEGDFVACMQLLRIAGPTTPAVNGMPRNVLHRILTEAAEAAGARIRLGLTVSAITAHEDHVDIVLSDGAKEKYDLVVGADGIRC
jgi:2-polyprenyl-6-methoxyphenol hydroxylase-like FAD-dependent oxidoreductase